jgi:hypothetical protein
MGHNTRNRRATNQGPIAVGLLLLLCAGARVASAEPPSHSAAPEAASAAAPARARDPLLAYAIGALGLSGIAVGGTTGFLALTQKATTEDHCSATLRVCDATGRAATNMGRTLRDISTVAWIVGGLGFGLSAYLLLSAPSQKSEVAMVVVVDGASPQAALVAHF